MRGIVSAGVIAALLVGLRPEEACGLPQGGPQANPQAPATPPAAGTDLARRQQDLAERYQEFETVLQRMADLLRPSDPERAALLGRAFAQSRRDLIAVQFQRLIDELKKGEADKSVKGQEQLLVDMNDLLQLLLSEDRERQLRERRERIERYFKEIQRLQREQRELRALTERAPDANKTDEAAKELARRQQRLADEAKKLAQQIEQEDAKAEGSPGASPDKDPGGKTPDRPMPGEAPDQRGEADRKSGERRPGQPGDAKPPGDDPAERTPGKENLDNASRAMKDAQRRLEELKRERASESQDEALRELDKAIAELEEILRQLREEERQERLASLESRFQKVLAIQRVVQEETVRLDRVPAAQRTRADEQKAIALSRRENEMTAELDHTLVLLREDGTATAFPEVVMQLREDVVLVVNLLAKADVGSLTQAIEADIIRTLEELIESLRQEMEKSKQPPQQGQSDPQGPNSQNRLVEELAELKMIRSLQVRVTQRTEQFAGRATATKQAAVDRDRTLRDLAERQARIYDITRDILLGRNR